MVDLKTCLRSGYAALYGVTSEEDRAVLAITTACKDIKFQVWSWTPTKGLVSPKGNIIEFYEVTMPDGPPKKVSLKDPNNILAAYCLIKAGDGKKGDEGIIVTNKSILILMDYHIYLAKRDPVTLRLVKDAIAAGRRTARTIMVMGCRMELPPELEKEFTTVDYPMPTKEELLIVAKTLCESKGVEMNGASDAVMDAACGLTTNEFADAASASLTSHNEIVPSVIAEIKANTIKKSGILELIKPGVTFTELGGLNELKAWINRRKHTFTPKAKEYGLPPSKGVLLMGIQGGGKSMASRAIAAEFDGPLLRLDMGRLFSGLVGSSEGNVRAVINQIEAFGRCVVWIDEIDKGASGMVGAHDGDSGTTRRVIGTFLTYLAEKTSPVFIVATANDLTKLPPELLRKGRWDEMFFIDLPTVSERKEIWSAQIKMKKRKPKDFDLQVLAEATPGWTGAEIESLMGESLFSAFEKDEEPTTELLVELSKLTVPLSKTMAEQLTHLRAWAKGRCRSASTPTTDKK